MNVFNQHRLGTFANTNGEALIGRDQHGDMNMASERRGRSRQEEGS